MPTDRFSAVADAYEAMIDWPKRLANEEPFWRWAVERAGARRALDVACGTGHHAAMLHRWGLVTQGADLSEEMVRRCRERFGETPDQRWGVRGFDTPPADTFDLVFCVGNSLALAPDAATVDRTLAAMIAALRPGGLAIVQVLNLYRLPDGPTTWQKCVRTKLAGDDVLIHKGVHRSADRGYVDLLITPLDRPDQLATQSVSFLGFSPDQLAAPLQRAGATVEVYGDYRRSPYVPATSPDLLVVAARK